eukprot:3429502-Pleurochrysis_carterae.AAC.2
MAERVSRAVAPVRAASEHGARLGGAEPERVPRRHEGALGLLEAVRRRLVCEMWRGRHQISGNAPEISF